jgi:tubulin epsilon
MSLSLQGFKLGLCHQPPVGLPYSLLCLSNNCCIADTFTTLLARFDKLYKRRWAGPG